MIRGARVAWRALVLTLVLLGVPAARSAEPPRAEGAPGGHGLLDAMESRSLTVVGRIDEVRRLDRHGFAARVWIERVVGPHPRELAEGEPLRLAWEELATGRAPRFASPERVLVVLEPLGTASIWRSRIPDASRRRQTYGVALEGEAFLRDPAPGSLDHLHHYLSIAPGERDGPAGVRLLASLAEGAQPTLALAAARRLAGVAELAGKLDAPGEEALVGALQRPDAGPELQGLLVSVAASVRSASLAKRLSRALADRSPPPPAPLFEALARSADAGLGDRDLAWLLERPEAGYRLVVARSASRERVPTLRRLRADDPDPVVRAAALGRLRELLGADALPDALAGLADPDPGVRAEAARSAASLGEAAVAALREAAWGRQACCAESQEARRASVAALGLCGAAGRRALTEIARDHPDPALRQLAELALGELDSHSH